MSSDLADQLAIRDVLARYCHTCDDGAFAALGQLFAPEGTFTYGERTVAGRDKLIAYFTEVQTPERRGKHLVSNVDARVEGDRATVRSDWLFLVLADGVPTPRLTGRYDDVLVRSGDTWLLAERRVTPLQQA